MTDQDRAAALADFAEKDGYIDISATFEEAELRLWIKGMRLLAAPPADGDVMERVYRAVLGPHEACQTVGDETALAYAETEAREATERALAALRPHDRLDYISLCTGGGGLDLGLFGRNRKIEAGTDAGCTCNIRAVCSPPVPGVSRRGLIAAAGIGLLGGGTAPAAAAPSPSIRLLIWGQSLGAGWSSSPAFAAFVERLALTGEDRSVSLLNVAVGGTSVLARNARRVGGHWWDERRGIAGPLLTSALAAVEAAAEKPNVIIGIIGETDSAMYAGTTGPEDLALIRDWRDGWLAVTDALRAACAPNDPLSLPTFCQRLGPRNGDMDLLRGMSVVRRAQQHVVDARGRRIYWGARPDATIPTRDGLHPTDEGYAWIGQETAEAVRGRVRD